MHGKPSETANLLEPQLVRGGSSTSNLIEPTLTTTAQREQGVEISLSLSHTHLCLSVVFVGTEPLDLQQSRKFSVCRVVVHLFRVVQAHRTSANLHEPQQHRDSKVCRGLAHKFGVVRLYRTFSRYIVTGETRSARCLC